MGEKQNHIKLWQCSDTATKNVALPLETQEEKGDFNHRLLGAIGSYISYNRTLFIHLKAPCIVRLYELCLKSHKVIQLY